jgi:hypothetical protein
MTSNWWDKYPDADAAPTPPPRPKTGNWWDKYPDAPSLPAPAAGPPPSQLGTFGFDRPGVPEVFKKSYRGREIQQGATKEVLGGQARGIGELATLPGRVYRGQADLKDKPTMEQAIQLGTMMSPGSVAARAPSGVPRGREPGKGAETTVDINGKKKTVRSGPGPWQGQAAPISDEEMARRIEEVNKRTENNIGHPEEEKRHHKIQLPEGWDREQRLLDDALEAIDRARARNAGVKGVSRELGRPKWAVDLQNEIEQAAEGKPSGVATIAKKPLSEPPAPPGEFDLTPDQQKHLERYGHGDIARQRGIESRALHGNQVKRVQEAFDKEGLPYPDNATLSAAARLLKEGKASDPWDAYETAERENAAYEEHLKSIGPVDLQSSDRLGPGVLPLSAAATTQKTAVRIETGTGIWGRPTAGRELIRQQIGIKEQDTARQRLAFEQHRRLSNQMSPQESIDTIRYMQHRSVDGPLGKLIVDPRFQAVADEIRHGYLLREAELKSLDEFTRMQFEQDHFTQKWQDPRKAKDVWDGWMGKEGSTGFSKHKKYLDFDAGLAAGLTPKSYNIVDVAMNDFENIDRVIAMARSREIAEEQGYLKWAENSRQVPSDWVQLKGYGAERGFTRAYAPADFARNYNNFVGRGFLDTPLAGTFQTLRATTNGLTQLELSLSGYHAFTISRESIATGVADTVYAMTHGHPWQAAKNLGKTFASPVYYAAKGRKAGQIYLGITPGSQVESRAIAALVQANAHLGQLEPALISGRTRSLITQFHRGALVKDVTNSFRHIREADGFFRTIGTTAVEAGRAVGEVLNTITAPLFQHYIPAVKRGMMMDNMAQWLRTHPSAEWNEIVAQAREISDVADERFGEMRQDNLFWNPMVKQAAQVAMRSTSWAYGSWTQYAGGVKEIGSILSKGIGRRTSYLFADAFTTALIGGMTTYLFAGKKPSDWRDFVWGQTGGTTTVHAGKRTYKVDERVNLPGSIKEIVGVTAAVMDVYDYGSLSGFADYARNKENDFIRTMGELVTNQDWRGAPLINPFSKESILQQWFNVGWKAFGPISLKQEQPDAGSKLDFPGSALLGLRPAGRRWIDPEGYKQATNVRLQRAAKQDESYKRRRAADRVRHEDAISPY